MREFPCLRETHASRVWRIVGKLNLLTNKLHAAVGHSDSINAAFVDI